MSGRCSRQGNIDRHHANPVIVEEVRSVKALTDHEGEEVRNFLPEIGVEDQADSLDEEEATIGMEIA